MEVNELDLNKNEDSYIESKQTALIGSINGIIFYDFLYPYIYIILLYLVLGASYNSIVGEHQYLFQILVSLATSLTTLVAAIIIAKPRKLIKAYHMLNWENIQLIFSTLITMIAFTISYNLIISLLGVDVGGGNENQTNIVEYIRQVPILSSLAFIVVGPILEEITYRYFVFGGIRKISPKWAILISGFIFMLVHGTAGFYSNDANILRELLLLPPYMFSGCMLAHSYNKSNNLTVSTGVHILNNLLSFILSAI